MKSVQVLDEQIAELVYEHGRLMSQFNNIPFWERRKLHEECEGVEAELRYLRAELKAALKGETLPPNPGHILCERECEGCGAPLGRGVWVEKVEPGITPRLSPRNHTDEEVGSAFWEKYPYLIGVLTSKKVWGTCSDCRES